MKKGILILVLAILLISIFSIGFIYSQGAGDTLPSGGSVGGAETTGSDTGAQTNTQQRSDITQYVYPQETKSGGMPQRVYGVGDVGVTRNPADGTSIVTIGKGGSLEFTTNNNGKAGETTGSMSGYEGKVQFSGGHVSGLDVKNTPGKDSKLEIPMGKNNDVYKITPKENNGNVNLKMDLKNGDFYQITNRGNEISMTIPDGKGGKITFDGVKGEGSTLLHEPGKAWQEIVRTNDNSGKPMDIKAPTVEKGAGTQGTSDLFQVIGDRAFNVQYGNGQSVTKLPDGSVNKIEYNNINGKYYPNVQAGTYTIGNDPKKNGFETWNQYKEGDSNRNPQLNLVGDSNQIPKDSNGNPVPGSYLVLKQDSNGNSLGIVNTNDKQGFIADIKGENSIFTGMKKSDFVEITAGPKSGAEISNNNGMLDFSLTGDKTGQIRFDDNVVGESNKEGFLYRGLVFQKDSSGKLVDVSGLTTPNVEINLDKGLKITDQNGKIIDDINGKIVAVQDGDKVRMAVVQATEDSGKIIGELKNHELVQGEIMDPNSRVVVNPPNAPDNVHAPVEPLPVATSPAPPQPTPEQVLQKQWDNHKIFQGITDSIQRTQTVTDPHSGVTYNNVGGYQYGNNKFNPKTDDVAVFQLSPKQGCIYCELQTKDLSASSLPNKQGVGIFRIDNIGGFGKFLEKNVPYPQNIFYYRGEYKGYISGKISVDQIETTINFLRAGQKPSYLIK